jgi:ATP-dependent Clp protease ATP-binding subunit ClpC
MSYKFSKQLKEIISFSRDEAERLGNDYIGTEHLLLGLTRGDDSTVIRILKSFKVDIQEMRNKIELAVKSDKSPHKALPLNASAEQTIYGAISEAKISRNKKVQPEHLLLSILDNTNTAPAILDHMH